MGKPKIVLTLALLLCSCSASSHNAQESLVGRWEGAAELPGVKMQMSVDFFRDANGLSATINIPDERVLGKRLTNTRYASPRLSFDIPIEGGHMIFEGTRNGDAIGGIVRSGERQARVSLRYIGNVPQPPYSQEEVSFRNGDTMLRGTLLLPPTKGPHPAVILIHGSSTPSRDDFRFYADLFVRRGIAALIYDKRDVGGNSGGASRVDLRDLAGDALAAVGLLKGRNDINAQQIGLWGHSQGGWVAPIAAANSKDLAFVITFSGPGVTYAELDKYANATRLRARGFSEKEIHEAMAALTRLDEYVRHGGDRQALQTFLDDAWLKRWAAETTLLRRVPNPEDIKTWIRWRNLDLDPVSYWEQINVPVLVLFGELDDVVPVQRSVERIKASLKRSGNKDVTIKVFPKAGHTIQPAPDFLNTMLDWTVTKVTAVR